MPVKVQLVLQRSKKRQIILLNLHKKATTLPLPYMSDCLSC